MIGFDSNTKTKTEVEDIRIISLSDNRLIKIDPREEGFYDLVLNYKSDNESINAFINAVEIVKRANLKAFYKTKYDPSRFYDGSIVFIKGRCPIIKKSFGWWYENVEAMPSVENKRWHIANIYQYYAFLVWLINKLSTKSSIDTAIQQVVLDSKDLGHYFESENSKKRRYMEETGCREIFGCADLANSRKILVSPKCNTEIWMAGGDYYDHSYENPLANLEKLNIVTYTGINATAMLIL